MLVLESKISKASYARDFGRVEARVSLLVKTRQGEVPHWIHLRTSQPRHGRGPLRQRLTEDAVRLARQMQRFGHSTTPHQRAA